MCETPRSRPFICRKSVSRQKLIYHSFLYLEPKGAFGKQLLGIVSGIESSNKSSHRNPLLTNFDTYVTCCGDALFVHIVTREVRFCSFQPVLFPGSFIFRSCLIFGSFSGSSSSDKYSSRLFCLSVVFFESFSCIPLLPLSPPLM